MNKTLITRNLSEVTGNLDTLSATPSIYWGTAPTGRPHIAYFVPITKIADFIKAGCNVTIMFADLHAILETDVTKDILEYRCLYYETCIKGMLQSIGVRIDELTDRLKFIKGSDFQQTQQYQLDLMWLAAKVTEHDARKAGSEVVKQSANPKMSGLLYPLMQALDEEYLKCDMELGGIDQRKIFMFAEKHMPMLGYKKRIHLMNPMVPGLTGDKMSASEVNSKIDMLDTKDSITKKIAKVFCEPGNKDTPILGLLRMILFPFLNSNSQSFVINREEQYGGVISFVDYQSVEDSFINQTLSPADLKLGVVDELDKLIAPVRTIFETPEMRDLDKKAYPIIKAKQATTIAPEREIDPSMLDLRVGVITACKNHPDSEKLLIEEICVGDVDITTSTMKTRTIVSGLAKFYTPSEMFGKRVIVLCNLKPIKVGGIVSEGMVICASNSDHTNVELLVPNVNSMAGDRVWFEGFNEDAPVEQLNPKKKIFDTLSADMTIGPDKLVVYKQKHKMLVGTYCSIINATLIGGSVG